MLRRFGSLLDNYYKVALLGRPNVGKSTLFNLLLGKTKSLVHNTPGLTRDRIEGMCDLFGVKIKLVDSAGWEPERTLNAPSIVEKMKKQTLLGVRSSDAALFVVDVREGITQGDFELAQLLRKKLLGYKLCKENVILVANKAEQSFLGDVSDEIYKLGLGDPVYLSAAQNEGVAELYDRIHNLIPEKYFKDFQEKLDKRAEKYEQVKQEKLEELRKLEAVSGEDFNLKEWEKAYEKLNPPDASDYDSDSGVALGESVGLPGGSTEFKPVQLSVIGRPNVGKSSLINSLLKEERVISDPTEGTTRDSVYLEYVFRGRRFQIVDTAGLTKYARDSVSKLIKEDVDRAIKYSQVVILLFDANKGLSPMELNLARKVIEEGRVLLAVGNKWDLTAPDMKNKIAKYTAETLHRKITLKGLSLVFTSTYSKHNLTKCMEEVLDLYKRWNKRVSTGILNRWLEAFKRAYNLPSSGGQRLNIKYITQIKARPPTFYMFVNDRTLMKENYLKNFTSSLSKEFGFKGVSIRILVRDKHKKAAKQHKPSFKVLKSNGMSLAKAASSRTP
mgnify:CR=1 FL=1